MTEAGVDALLRELASQDVRIATDGDRLKVDAPRGSMSAELRTEIATHKDAIVRHLRGGDPSPPLEAVGREQQIHASFAQQRIWFLARLGQGGGYNIPISLWLDGSLDAVALSAAIDYIIERHEALRTHFANPEGDDKEPYQIIRPRLSLELSTLDLRAISDASSAALDDRIAAISREVASSPFDLGTGPLLRARLVQVTDARHLLLFTFHHTIFDGWSLGIFFTELAVAYEAFAAGAQPDLSPVPVQYPDYAVWQRRTLVDEELERLVHYWREHLRGAPALIDLPTDRSRPAVQSFAGGRVHRVLEGRMVTALEDLSRRERVTLNMTLLAAFAVLLSRYARTEDLVIGTPIANRNDVRLEGVIGFVANVLALRFQPARARSFAAFLAEVKSLLSAAYAHQTLPFERVVEALKVERSLDRNPVYQVMFSYKEALFEDFELAGVNAEFVDFEHEESAFDLTLNVRRHQDHFVAIFEYSSDLFDRPTIERLADNFHTLLGGIVEDPRARLSALPLVAPEQLHQMLQGFNRTTLDMDLGDPVHLRVQQRAFARPDAIAVTDGDASISYDELNRRANRLAWMLVEFGVAPGVLVAVCLARSIETFVAILAVLKAGGAYVPLDPQQPERRLKMMLEDSRAPILLTHSQLRAGLPESEARRVICLDEESEFVGRFPSAPLDLRSSLDDLAYVIYTSGTTGTPKGAMISHRAILNTHHGYRRCYRLDELGEDLCHLQMANPAFDVFTGEWVRTLCNGARMVLCSAETLAAPEELYELMVAERIGCAEFMPLVARRLCDYLEQTDQRLDFMSCCIIGSDILHARDFRRARALCGPDAQVANAYGITEAAVTSVIADRIEGTLEGDAIAPIGRPMANVRVYILDEDLQPVPLGVYGELCLAGPGLADGYYKRPELSAEKFVEVELLGERERIYRSGDLSRWHPSGELEFFGRLDYQVKVRGQRIELGEIEAALLEHPAVSEVVVMLVGDSGNPMLAAWLVLSRTLDGVPFAMRAFLESRIPRYMVPATFVVLPAMPVTPNGKVDRRSLPDPVDDHRRSCFVAPRDSIELELVLVWERLLGRSPIGVTEDFFAVGGDSLLCLRLVSIIERTFGIRVPLHTLFQTATIERLASILRHESASMPWSPLVCLQPHGEKSPLFFVHAAGGIVFRYIQTAALLGDERPFYGIQARGIEPGDPPYPSIEAMAIDYVKAIREVQPTGPYLIGGWSFGGAVAYEMVRVLEAQGESVPVLFMIDTPSPYMDSYETDDVEFLLERLRPSAGLELAEIDTLSSREEKLLYLFEQQRLAGMFTPDIADADARLRLKIHKHHNEINCKYRPAGPCNAKIVFFEPTESIPFDTRMKNPAPAWRGLALGGMEICSSPGNHFNMFSADNGPRLAEKLRALIEKLD